MTWYGRDTPVSIDWLVGWLIGWRDCFAYRNSVPAGSPADLFLRG